MPIIEASPISPEQAATTEASAHEAQPAQEPGEDAEALAFGGATGSEAPTALPEAPAAVVPAASTQETARRPESPQSGSLEAGEVHKAPPPTSDAQDATPIAEAPQVERKRCCTLGVGISLVVPVNKFRVFEEQGRELFDSSTGSL